MDQNTQGSADTGTRDDTYDVISVLYHALQGVENCELFAEDASGDQELRQFFDRACDQQRQLADEAKRLLQDRLMRDAQGGGSGSGSAFFGSGGGSSGMSSGSGGGMGGGQDMGDRRGSTEGLSPNSSDAGQTSSFGQSALGQGPRHTQMTTGGGGTSTF